MAARGNVPACYRGKSPPAGPSQAAMQLLTSTPSCSQGAPTFDPSTSPIVESASPGDYSYDGDEYSGTLIYDSVPSGVEDTSFLMSCSDVEDEGSSLASFRAMVARDRAAWDAKQGQRDAEDAAHRAWLADAPRREAEERARLLAEEQAERQRCEAEGRWYDSPKAPPNYPLLSAEMRARFRAPPSAMRGPAACARAPTTPPADPPAFLRYPEFEGWSPQLPQGAFTTAQASPHPLVLKHQHPMKDAAKVRERLDHTRRRLFEEDESDDEGDDEGDDEDDAGNTTHIVTMEEVLSKMTAAQARRRYAPSWAFIAWEVDRAWFSTCLETFFEQLRWPVASRVPAAVRAVCRESGVGMQELYVQEAFAPKYVAVARSVDREWFDWLVDEFFSSGSWPRFDELPEGIQSACAQAGVRPNDLV